MDRTTVVDPDHHRAQGCRRRAAADRPRGADRDLAQAAGRRPDADHRKAPIVIIMDDGFQSAALRFDYALMVIDSMSAASAMAFSCPPVPSERRRRCNSPMPPRCSSSVTARAPTPSSASPPVRASPSMKALVRAGRRCRESRSKDKRVLAFAGIADPDRSSTARWNDLGAEIVAKRSFGDHQHMTDDEIDRHPDDIGEARISPSSRPPRTPSAFSGHHGRAQDLAGKTTVIDVEMAFDSPTTPRLIIEEARWRISGRRRLAAKAG